MINELCHPTVIIEYLLPDLCISFTVAEYTNNVALLPHEVEVEELWKMVVVNLLIVVVVELGYQEFMRHSAFQNHVFLAPFSKPLFCLSEVQSLTLNSQDHRVRTVVLGKFRPEANILFGIQGLYLLQLL